MLRILKNSLIFYLRRTWQASCGFIRCYLIVCRFLPKTCKSTNLFVLPANYHNKWLLLNTIFVTTGLKWELSACCCIFLMCHVLYIYFVLNAAENYAVIIKIKKKSLFQLSCYWLLFDYQKVTSRIIMCFTSVYSCTSLVIVICITSS